MSRVHCNNLSMGALYHSGRHLTLYTSLRRVPFCVFASVPSVDIKCSTRFTGLKRARMSHAVNWKMPLTMYLICRLLIACTKMYMMYALYLCFCRITYTCTSTRFWGILRLLSRYINSNTSTEIVLCLFCHSSCAQLVLVRSSPLGVGASITARIVLYTFSDASFRASSGTSSMPKVR